MEKYQVTSITDAKGMVEVKRMSDGKTSAAKFSWLKPVAGAADVFTAKSRTKALRMDGLDWN